MSNESHISVIVHKNGDVFQLGKRLVINPRQVRSWEYFLEYLRRSFGEVCPAIREIATPTGGTRLKDLQQLENQHRYVAIPSGEKLKHLDYVQVDENLRNPKPILGKEALFARLRKRHKKELANTEGRIKNEMGKRGKTVYIYRNGDEFTRAIHVYLTPMQMQELEIILRTIGERVVLQDNRAIRRLFAMDGRQILDADEVEDGQSYVACGQENMHQCQYGHALPRLQVGTARKKPKHHGVHYLHDLPDDLNDRVCEQLSHHTPRYQKPTKALPPLNSLRQTESQRVLIERAHHHQPSPSRLDLGLKKSAQEHDCPSCRPLPENPENAAIKIQASYRGFRVRQEKKRQEQAAKKIQAGFRGYTTRKKLAEIQNTHKMKRQERPQESELRLQLDENRENSAAMVIQAHYRGYRTRKSLLKQTKKEQDTLARNQTYAMVMDKENNGVADEAAAKIQAGFRGYKVRKMYKQEKQRLNEAATKIQAGFRGYKTRKNRPKKATIESPRVEEIGDESRAATKIQATFRGYKTRKQLRDRRQPRPTEEENMAATRIQANYRGYKVRKAITGKQARMIDEDEEALMAEE